MPSTRKGATAPPSELPLSKRAVASARSWRGNHSLTTFVAPGQLPDSPAPSRKRSPAKLQKPLANEVRIDTAEYQATVSVRPRLAPTRSISRPHADCPNE